MVELEDVVELVSTYFVVATSPASIKIPPVFSSDVKSAPPISTVLLLLSSMPCPNDKLAFLFVIAFVVVEVVLNSNESEAEPREPPAFAPF